ALDDNDVVVTIVECTTDRIAPLVPDTLVALISSYLRGQRWRENLQIPTRRSRPSLDGQLTDDDIGAVSIAGPVQFQVAVHQVCRGKMAHVRGAFLGSDQTVESTSYQNDRSVAHVGRYSARGSRHRVPRGA